MPGEVSTLHPSTNSTAPPLMSVSVHGRRAVWRVLHRAAHVASIIFSVCFFMFLLLILKRFIIYCGWWVLVLYETCICAAY